MGGMQFTQIAEGKDARDAFDAAVEQARYDHGHAGYTGTIAEKPGFFIVHSAPMDDDAAHALAESRIDDNEKWGDAFCIPLTDRGESKDGKRRFLFFGWASS